MISAYYNDNDPSAAGWLENLSCGGLIPDGKVDRRSIHDVRGDDLREYRQVHLFAGIGGWSLALQLAGWPEDRPVWTGSCPCQPYSLAGKRKGHADDRNLWPEMFRLVRECRPDAIFGEQVPGAIGHGWLDGVFTDLEGEGYTCGAIVLGAHSVGAPHIRQRLFWVAQSRGAGLEVGREQPAWDECSAAQRGGLAGGAEHAEGDGRAERRAESRGRSTPGGCGPGGMGDTKREGVRRQSRGFDRQETSPGYRQYLHDPVAASSIDFWANFHLVHCRDQRSRRVEPGTFPLAAGVPGRVVLLRGYGNSIVPQVAATFIEAFMQTEFY